MRMIRKYIGKCGAAMIIVLFLLCSQQICAQKQIKNYIVKNGKMFIELGRDLSEASLDSFIIQFNLSDIGLKQFMKKNTADSLLKSGWSIEINNETGFVISKRFAAYDLKNPLEKMILAETFPGLNTGIAIGYNRFKNKHPFSGTDSIVRFFLRGHSDASHVMLAGSFNNWSPAALQMNETDSGWIAVVKLGPGKYWYKFIVDGHWMVDNDNLLKENDGRGNINSVFYKTNHVFKTSLFTEHKKLFVVGSFNNWKKNEMEMTRTTTGWELPVYLGEGTHSYKFIADGNWYTDEQNALKISDGQGGYNSIIKIGNPFYFKLDGYSNAKKVALSASFNGWKDDELLLNKTASGWELPYTIGAGNHEYKYIVDGKPITDPGNSLKSGNGNSYLIINPNHTFRLKGFNNAKQVYVAGNFNAWGPKSFPMKKIGNEWVFDVFLSPGKHTYKFVIDDKWIIDPANKLWEQNEHGTGNSVIWMETGKQ